MKFLIVAVLALAALALAARPLHTESQFRALFKNYVQQFNKHYKVDEIHIRYSNFKVNLDKVKMHNEMTGAHSYKMAVNQFADLSKAEFTAKFLGYRMRDRSVLRARNQVDLSENNTKVTLPAAVNWVTAGAVTAVKNQGQCGGCWAFSATGSTEGAHFIKTGNLVSLSEQQLLDCSTAQGNQGCNGGLMDDAFQYIISNDGLCSESDYSFTGTDGTCASSSCTSVASISSFTDVTPNSESALTAAIAQQPVSVAIEADQDAFQFYSSGVLNDASCGTQLDHGVLAAGYGHDSASGLDYYLVKNSWGPSWGLQGYIKIVRNIGAANSANQCGITSDPSYPVV